MRNDKDKMTRLRAARSGGKGEAASPGAVERSEIERLPGPLAIQSAELDVLEVRDTMTVAQWAEQKRVLSAKTTDLAGPWSHEYTPFLVEPMEALSDVGTRQVTVRKCAQAGWTELCCNFIGYAVDEKPAPMLLVMPREDDANRRVGTRIRPMFESTPSLAAHLNRPEDLNTSKETQLDSMILFIAWAGSPAAMADNPICYVVLDEVGKFPAKSGAEADPVSLARDRLRTFGTRSKLAVGSTPVLENDLIDAEYQAGDQRKWWARCVHCGEFHEMGWGNVILETDDEGKLLDETEYRAGGRANYVCPKCGVAWTEMERWAAVSAGRFAPKGTTVDVNGRLVGKVKSTTHRSYQISAWMLYPGFTTIDELAAKWAAANAAKRTGNVGPLQNFINSEMGEPWVEREKRTEVSPLRDRIDTYPAGSIPGGVQLLTAGVDVQADHLYVVLVGWGWLSEAWMVYEAVLETGDTRQIKNYQPLTQFLAMTWPMENDPERMVRVGKVGIDCGFQPHAVRDYCNSVSGMFDIVRVRGDDSVRDSYRRVKDPHGGVDRFDLNVNIFKEFLFRMLFTAGAPPGAGYCHIHAEPDNDLLEQLASEEQRPKRIGRRVRLIWQVKTGGRANHYWDCAVYASAAAELAGARMLSNPDETIPPPRRQIGRMRRFAGRNRR